jgi:hypothetical protein
MYALFNEAEWWVVYVRAEADPIGAVYGGRGSTVHRVIREHAAHAGPLVEMTAKSFADGHDSLVARVEMENALYSRAAA